MLQGAGGQVDPGGLPHLAYSFRFWLTTESAPPSFHSNNRKHMVSAKLLTQLVIGYAVSLPLLFAYGTYFGHGLARTASAYGAE